MTKQSAEKNIYVPQRPPQTEMHRVRGLNNRVLRWGPPSESPIVLLHGFYDTADTYQFLVDALPDDWSFVAPDWRGFGYSDSAGSSYWFPDYLADLDQLLDVLSPTQPARVVGHSMGANVAELYGGVRPARLRWIISLEGFGLPRTRVEQAPERFAQWLNQLRAAPGTRRYESIAQLTAILRMRNSRLSTDRAMFIANAWSRPAVDGAGFELRADPAHRQVNPVLYRRDEAAACWQRITVPVLFLLGADSEFWPRLGDDGTEPELRRNFRDVDIETLADVGHMMHHERPEAVAEHMIRFLERRHL